MKAMRVLNCTKEDREIIFKIADKAGCPVDEYTRKEWHTIMEHVSPKDMTYDGKRVIGWHGAYGVFNDVSFTEFITELLKYEKPKKWVTKDRSESLTEIIFSGGYTEYIYQVYCPHRNPKFTYEVEE